MTVQHKNLIFLGLLLLAAVLAFGLQVSKLGFYVDDWIIIQSFSQGGAQGLIDYAAGKLVPLFPASRLCLAAEGLVCRDAPL